MRQETKVSMHQRRPLQIASRVRQEEGSTIASSYQKLSSFCYLIIPTKNFFSLNEETQEQEINELPFYLIFSGESTMVSDEELMQITCDSYFFTL